MTRRVVTEAAEQAQGDIRLLQAERVRTDWLRGPVPLGRVPGFEPTAAERATQLAVTTIVAIAEHFSASRLRAQPNVTDQDVRNWPNQEKAWAKYAGVSLSALSAYQPFRGFNEARNAIMHGRGTLTPLQLSPSSADAVRKRIAAAGIRCIRNNVVITHDDLGCCADICWAFVGQLDAAAP
jgi:hypothetical protein